MSIDRTIKIDGCRDEYKPGVASAELGRRGPVNAMKQVRLGERDTASPVQPVFSALFVFLVRLLSEAPPPGSRLCFKRTQACPDDHMCGLT